MLIEPWPDLGYGSAIEDPRADRSNMQKTLRYQSLGNIQQRLRTCLTSSLAAGLLAGVCFGGYASADEFTYRIVGGTPVPITLTPSIVAVLQKDRLESLNSSFRAQFCGGTVISTRWVVTAAHCMVQRDGAVRDPDNIVISMGADELDGGTETFIDVSSVVVHEAFISAQGGNDIALLQLSSDAVVAPAVLERFAIRLNDDAIAAGWGALSSAVGGEQQVFPRRLQGVALKMIPGDQCSANFARYSDMVSARQICAGVPDGGKDSCQGDSGGPLFKRAADESLTLAGITSWGLGCAEATAPGIYTRIGAYIDWIENAIGASPVTPVVVSTGGDVINGTLGGGAALLILPLLLVVALVRRLRHAASRWWLRASAVAALSFFLASCATALPLVSGDQAMISLQRLEASLGREMPAQLVELKSMWRSDAVCESQRTAVGNDRRAYFLDTCSFTNTEKAKVCGYSPGGAAYYFLEGNLILVHLEYTAEAPDLAVCVTAEAAEAGYLPATQLGEVTVASDRQLMLNADQTVAVMVGAGGLTLLQPDIAPDVQFLNALFVASVE